MFEGGLIIAAIAIGAILNNSIGYVSAAILLVISILAWVLGKQDGAEEFQDKSLLNGAIPDAATQPGWDETIDPNCPPIFGHADLLIQRLSIGDDLSVAPDGSTYQINLGLFVRTSVSTTDKPRTISAFVLELSSDAAIYSGEAAGDIGNYCHRYERHVNEGWGRPTIQTVRDEMHNLLALLRTTPIAPDMKVEGWLRFELKNVTKGQEPKYGGKLRLYAFDVRKNRYELDTSNLNVRAPDSNEYAQQKEA